MLVCESSDRLTADTAILASSGYLCSVIVEGDGTNAASVIIYDNASAASGTILAKILVDAGLVYESYTPSAPIVAKNGIYADVTGTGCAVIVHFSRG